MKQRSASFKKERCSASSFFIIFVGWVKQLFYLCFGRNCYSVEVWVQQEAGVIQYMSEDLIIYGALEKVYSLKEKVQLELS